MNTLIGSWKLKSFTLTKDGVTNPWRENVSGTLIYTEKGSMSVAMNSKLYPGDDLFDSILFYSGSWSFELGNDGQAKVHHHIENATDLTNIGKTLTRNMTFHDNNLELSAEGDFGRASVVWTPKC